VLPEAAEEALRGILKDVEKTSEELSSIRCRVGELLHTL